MVGARRSAFTAWRASFSADQREAIQRAALFAQGGEFAFVLYAAALAAGVIDARIAAMMTAIVIISMALAPLVVMAQKRLTPAPEEFARRRGGRRTT